jgi:hypothetical protein
MSAWFPIATEIADKMNRNDPSPARLGVERVPNEFRYRLDEVARARDLLKVIVFRFEC